MPHSTSSIFESNLILTQVASHELKPFQFP